MRLSLRLVLAAALVSPGAAAAHEYRLGALRITHPVLRVASPVSKTGAGYLAISNSGRVDDRLIAVTTAAANRSDLHGTIAHGAVMQMRAQAGGVPVPAGGRVAFAPGGLHVMFIGLKGDMPAGRMIPVQLLFEKAGRITVQFKVEAIAAAAHNH
ncbi:MAG: copper chaperone PCu(A)C [Alphaproteobacteria bacterium]|nr:copper chaperone PCu(A)C [Alphaproteobacteria bacterium]